MTTSETYRNALVEAVLIINPEVWITLNVAHTASLAVAARDVEHWLQRLESDVYGKRWSRRPPHMRLRAYAFFEHPESNLHAHLALGDPSRLISNALFRGVPLWRAMTHVGHGDADVIDSAEAVARYITKNTGAPWSMEHFIAYGPDRRK